MFMLWIRQRSGRPTLRMTPTDGTQVEHWFSCECCPEKQAWIRNNFPHLKVLFADIGQLGGDTAFDVISGRRALSRRSAGAM